MEDTVEMEILSCQKNVLVAKQAAQAMGVFLKTGTAKKFIETCIAMRGDTITSQFSASGATLYCWVRVGDLEGIKDERLQGILTAFEFMNPDQQETSDYAAGRLREFKFRWRTRVDSVHLSVCIEVAASIKEDSETCKRIVIGYTDGKPEPIYKLECSDQEPAPEGEV